MNGVVGSLDACEFGVENCASSPENSADWLVAGLDHTTWTDKPPYDGYPHEGKRWAQDQRPNSNRWWFCLDCFHKLTTPLIYEAPTVSDLLG